jgi:hypothetical protein
MTTRSVSFLSRIFLSLLTMAMLFACSPQYNWREVHGTAIPFSILMPGKPAVYAHSVNLDGMQVTMTMTGAEVDNVTFAVGTAELPDTAHAQAALAAMKKGLVNNIGGTIRSEKSVAFSHASGGTENTAEAIEIEAVGAPGPNTDGQSRLLVARFIAQDKQIYQIVVVGRENAVKRDAVDTFFSSFKLH